MVGGEDWFGVRCLFKQVRSEGTFFEERITIWPATSGEAAIAAAEVEAEQYSDDVGSEYLGLAQGYGLITDARAEDARLPSQAAGSEVFSLTRRSDLDSEYYVKRFFATEAERLTDV